MLQLKAPEFSALVAISLTRIPLRRTWILTRELWGPAEVQVMVWVVPFVQTVPREGAVTLIVDPEMENCPLVPL